MRYRVQLSQYSPLSDVIIGVRCKSAFAMIIRQCLVYPGVADCDDAFEFWRNSWLECSVEVT